MTGRGTILVTGGAGYIGSHTCKALARAGWTPVTYDNLCRGAPASVKWGPLEEGDIGDERRLSEAIGRWRPVAVMHFAGYAYVGESMADPAMYYRNNVVSALSMLDCMRSHALNNIVFSSSCATYGVPDRLPIAETCPQRPINPYGRSKLMFEAVLDDFGRAYGLRWMALRYFNALGCDPEGEIGEAHDPEPHVLPRAIMAARGASACFDVNGSDYGTDDGSAVRDYVHVSDLAEAHVTALGYLLGGGDCRAVNLGLSRGYSVLELVKAVERISGRSVPVRLGPRRPGDPPALVADAALAREILGFSPKYPELEDMVAHAWRWFEAKGSPR